MNESSSGIRKFSELGIEGPMEGDKVKMPDVLNRAIVIRRVEFRISKHHPDMPTPKEYAMVQFYYSSDQAKVPRMLFTESVNIVNQLKVAKQRNLLPFETVPKQLNKSYTLT